MSNVIHIQPAEYRQMVVLLRTKLGRLMPFVVTRETAQRIALNQEITFNVDGVLYRGKVEQMYPERIEKKPDDKPPPPKGAA